MPDATNDDHIKTDNLKKTTQEELDTADTSPEDRRRQYNQQEGREVDSFPLPSDDGDDPDDEDDREP